MEKQTLKTIFLPIMLGFMLMVGTFTLLGLLVKETKADLPSNYADIVVRQQDGRITMRRITFTRQSISGLEALQKSGLNVVQSGGAVCSIDQLGCPIDNCFCACKGEPCAFWNYAHWQNNHWEAASGGAGEYTVTNGTIDGWAWGAWGTVPPSLTPEITATQLALTWLHTQQRPDGSFVGFGGNVGSTLDTLLAVAAANDNLAAWTSSSGNSMLDYLKTNGLSFASKSAAGAGKLVLGVAAARQEPHNFAGLDLVSSIQSHYSPTVGVYGTSNWDQAMSILGLVAAREKVPPVAINLLSERAVADGGWGYVIGGESDVDTTALVIQALIAAGQPTTLTAVVNGLAYIRRAQTADGGFATTPGELLGNTNSTALALQAFLAAGSVNFITASGTTPLSFLLKNQQGDGRFGWQIGNVGAELFATQQAIPALMGKPYPLVFHSTYLPIIQKN